MVAVEAGLAHMLVERIFLLCPVQVACWLPDCLIWAAHRVGGRISAACLEATVQERS